MGALLRAFVKTLAERHHAMVLVDAPNLRAAEFREFWQAGQRAGYEVYVLRPLETDAEVRAAATLLPPAVMCFQAVARDPDSWQ